jgi:hypothetical protein
MEYWNGYYAGRAAAMRAVSTVRRIELEQTRRTSRKLRWIAAGYWACVALVAIGSGWAYLDHGYSRVNAFEDGTMLMSVLLRASRPRYPR